MDKNKKIFFSCLIICILIIIIIIFNVKNFKNRLSLLNMKNNQTQEEGIQEQNNSKIEEIKNEIGITGNTELYEIQKGDDNKEIAVIKPNIKYKVAFAGIIKKQKPNTNELDDTIEKEHPQSNGIWIEKNSREKVLEMLKEVTKATYEIDSNGYLKNINDTKSTQNNNDKILENAINSNKVFILDISSTCYIIDDITGEIMDFNFEKLDRYQTYEYFKDNNNCIIFITENNNKVLEEKEIIESVLTLISGTLGTEQ